MGQFQDGRQGARLPGRGQAVQHGDLQRGFRHAAQGQSADQALPLARTQARGFGSLRLNAQQTGQRSRHPGRHWAQPVRLGQRPDRAKVIGAGQEIQTVLIPLRPVHLSKTECKHPCLAVGSHAEWYAERPRKHWKEQKPVWNSVVMVQLQNEKEREQHQQGHKQHREGGVLQRGGAFRKAARRKR